MTRCLWTLLLALALLPLGCPGTMNFSDDDDAGDDDAGDDDAGDDDAADDDVGDDDVGDDDVGDDDSGDDDGDPEMSVSETDFTAGEWVWVDATFQNFEIGQQTGLCCYDPAAMEFWGTSDVTSNSGTFWWRIGLLTDGTQPWGLQDGNTQVTVDFDITPRAVPDVGVGEPAASGAAGGDVPFAAWRYEETQGGRWVVFRPNNLGVPAFEPYIWLSRDGTTTHSINWDYANEEFLPAWAIYMDAPGMVYVRIQDGNFVDDPAQTFDLDVVAEDTGTASNLAEVEPNDDPADAQDLGSLDLGGILTIDGEIDSIQQGSWDGDNDSFAFQVAAAVAVQVTMTWNDPADDYDFVVWDVTSSPPDFNQWSNAVGYGASLDHPEIDTISLSAGNDYLLWVSGYSGNTGPYEVELAVSPSLE